MSLFKEVKEIIIETLGLEDDNITPEAAFVKDLEADSLDLVELVTVIEEKYDVEIDDDEVEKMVTVGDVVKFLEKRISKV